MARADDSHAAPVYRPLRENVFLHLSGICQIYTFVGLLGGIVTDISYGFIDPRIRMGSKK